MLIFSFIEEKNNDQIIEGENLKNEKEIPASNQEQLEIVEGNRCII